MTFSELNNMEEEARLIDKHQKIGVEAERQRILGIIEKVQNPYPKDIFVWDSKIKADITNGRFNQFCFEIVENIKEEIKKAIEELK